MAHGHRHFPRNNLPLSETAEMWIFVGSIVGAVYLIQSNAIAYAVAHTQPFGVLGSFIEGFLFTSILTTTPAIVAILGSASYVPAWELALFGALGAVCGDLLLFRFVRSRLVEHILRATFHPRAARFGAHIASGPLWWLGPLLGAIIIASPLPDELGLFMMGLSHIRLLQIIPLVFVANLAGIYLMALVVQNLG